MQIRGALALWRGIWNKERARKSEQQWAAYGFYQTGFNFWLVTQLVLSTPASVSMLMQMEFGCEDALALFRTLLPDTTQTT